VFLAFTVKIKQTKVLARD